MTFVTRIFSLQKRWHQVQILLDDFWKCWLHEYLLSLTLLSKWTAQKEQIDINNFVLIKEDNVKRGWKPLGRVVEVHLREDELLEQSLQTTKGTYKRPAAKMF